MTSLSEEIQELYWSDNQSIEICDEIINKVLDAAVEAVEKAIDKDAVFGQQERALNAINNLRGEK